MKRINGSILFALIICIALGIWMAAGEVVVGGQAGDGAEGVSIAERNKTQQTELFKVSYIEIEAIERIQSVAIRGRTKADAIIPIRAETSGILEKRLVERGDKVEAGDAVCILDSGARQASLDSAKAALTKAEADHKSALGLNKKGFSSDTQVRQMKAALDPTQRGRSDFVDYSVQRFSGKNTPPASNDHDAAGILRNRHPLPDCRAGAMGLAPELDHVQEVEI